VTEVIAQSRVIALDRLWSADGIGCRGDLLDTVFGWSDLGQLRRLVAARCAAAGLSAGQVEDFVLAIHEIAANAIMHAGAGGRLILRRTGTGLRCLITDTDPRTPVIPNIPPAAPALDNLKEFPRLGGGPAGGDAGVPDSLADARDLRERDLSGYQDPGGAAGRMGAESGRGLWLAAQLADELSITSGPEGTVVSLYKYF
jgi:anti-sigma regulatory factor (Ser/Thr protein kinase)